MKKISQLFLQGMFAVLPIVLTVAVLFWLGSVAEQTLGQLIQWLLPKDWYWTGMGIVVGFVFVMVIGVLANAYVFQRLGGIFNDIINRIPLVKMIYNSVRDVAQFASVSENNEKSSQLQKAVLVTVDNDKQVIGFITSESLAIADFENESDKNDTEDENKKVAVYIPMSYQIGGFTIIVDKSSLQPLDMKISDAMRFVLTAGITKND